MDHIGAAALFSKRISWHSSSVSESPQTKPVRPTLLVVALIVCWVLGLHTALDGYATVRIIGNPLAADALQVPAALRDALLSSISANANTVLPVAIAQILLGGLLVIVSAGVLLRARISLGFGLQVLGANGLLFVVGYSLAGPVRDALVAALVKLPELQANDVGGTEGYYWAFRLRLAAQLMALIGAAWALTRPASRNFLAYTSPKEES